MTDQDSGDISSKNDNNSQIDKQPPTNMSDRDIKWRAKYKASKQELEEIKINTEKNIKEISDKVSNIERQKSEVESQWLSAELKAEAIAAGIKDLDLIRLIDTSSLKVDNGSIVGLKEAVQEFKNKKPDFFGSDKKTSSSTNAPLPSTTIAKPKNAYDYSKEEWDSKVRQRAMRGLF